MGKALLRSLLVVSATAIAFSMAADVYAANSLTIEQDSQIGAYAEWRLSGPTGLVVNRNKDSKVVTEVAAGQHLLQVEAPLGARTTINFIEAGTLIKSFEGTEIAFILPEGITLTIVIEFVYDGEVIVESTPAGAAFELRGPQGVRYTGVTPARFREIPPVYFDVHFGLIDGCQTPKAQGRQLILNTPLVFSGNYVCDNEKTVMANVTDTPANGTDPISPMSPYTTARDVQSNVRLSTTVAQTETVPGSNVEATVGIRNIGLTTLDNVMLSVQFDPSVVTIETLPKGAYMESDTVVWNIPSIYAGQSWTSGFSVHFPEDLPEGQTAHLTARISGDNIRVQDNAELVQSTMIGIASIPATGMATDLLFLLVSILTVAVSTMIVKNVRVCRASAH